MVGLSFEIAFLIENPKKCAFQSRPKIWDRIFQTLKDYPQI